LLDRISAIASSLEGHFLVKNGYSAYRELIVAYQKLMQYSLFLGVNRGAVQSMTVYAAAMPAVSVVIPTHNRADMLAEALASVQAQTFQDYEIIVVSNGESPGARLASRAIAVARDARYFELETGNASMARNYGIEQARGEWIALLDDDDLWLPRKLERQVAEAERTGADMIVCDYIESHLEGREIIRRWRLLDGWSYTQAINRGYWSVQPSAAMIRKRVFAEIGAFDPRLRYNEDNDMWRRISWRHTIHQMDDVLTRYRCGHLRMMDLRFERIRYFYDLCHLMKMRRDTPDDLRLTLPPAAVVIFPRLVGICAPRWLLTLLHWFGPRLRWLKFRRWLGARLQSPAIPP
jgi:glycosyltransferase involved in cell wall biosynthesis